MLTNEELAMQIQGGNGEVISLLWDQCKGFIWKEAIRWKGAFPNRPDFDVEDLTQCGYFALRDAVQAFDPERGSFLNLLTLYLKTEFAKAIGCRTTAQTKEPLFHALRLDAPVMVGDDGTKTYGDMIPVEEEGFERVEESMYRAHVSEVVKDALCALPSRYREIMQAHFLQGKSYRTIADEMCISKARCGQLVGDALKKLRRGKDAETMAKLLWGERNFYAHTGLTAYKESGSSVQEHSLLWKEREEKKHRLNGAREYKIKYCMERLGMDQAEAERYFPV